MSFRPAACVMSDGFRQALKLLFLNHSLLGAGGGLSKGITDVCLHTYRERHRETTYTHTERERENQLE